MLALVLVLLSQVTPDSRVSRVERVPGGRMEGGRGGVKGWAFFEAFPVGGAGTTTACSTTPPTGAKGEVITTKRSTVAECISTDGQVITQVPVDVTRVMSGRIDDPVLGVLADEEGRTNDIPYARDFSQASWVKTSMTCTKTATGMRADANGASTCTATAANGTVCVSIVRAATAASASGFIKRRTGTSAITVARDGASYSSDIAASVSSSLWRRIASTDVVGTQGGNTIVVTGMTSSVANPSICIKLAASGDAVDLDFWQEEVGSYSSMPIATSGAAAPRATEITDVTINTTSTQFPTYSMAGTAIVSAPIAVLPLSPVFGGVWAQVATPGVSNPTVYTDSYALTTRAFRPDDSQALPTPYVSGLFVPVTPGVMRVATYFDGSIFNGCVDGTCAVGSVVTWTAANRNVFRLGGYNATNNNFGGVRKRICLDPNPRRCL